MRFKPGDRVILMDSSRRALTIIERGSRGFWTVLESPAFFNEQFFVLEAIYNSPLYKALL